MANLYTLKRIIMLGNVFISFFMLKFKKIFADCSLHKNTTSNIIIFEKLSNQNFGASYVA